MIKNILKTKAFTLVETLVAITILTTSILALLTVLSQSLSSTTFATKKMVATYIGQEGIEYMRNLRDTYVLYYNPNNSQEGWDQFKNSLIVGSCVNPAGCYFDDRNINYTDQTYPMRDLTITACGSSCPPLLYDPAAVKYNYAVGTDSGYTRKINMTQVSANEVKISATVSWTQGSGTATAVFSESLYNWVE